MSAKLDMLKEIEAKVKRKKALAIEVAREKTIYYLAADFFAEVAKSASFAGFAVNRFRDSLRGIDSRSSVHYFHPTDEGPGERLEIHWSDQYIHKHGCEPVMVIDSATAQFEKAMERL
jgi:hypothetical protein